VQRIFWYDWPLQWRRELDAMHEGRCLRWSLPSTASADETVLAGSTLRHAKRAGMVVIAAAHRDTAEALMAACRSEGYSCVWRVPHVPVQLRGAMAAVWSASDCGPTEARGLRRLSEELPGLPIAALLDFPRVEDIARAREAGAAVVFSKPVWLDDLWDWLAEQSQIAGHAPT
jgi:CheY-like chemotaxis protein